MLAIPIALLAAVGLLIATYFTAVAFRWVQPDAAWVPAFCQLGEESCAAIVFTPRARLLGAPNSVLGQLYYLSLLVAVGGGLLDPAGWLQTLLAASAVTVAMGAYLTYSLLFITRVNCRLCFTSHAINLALFVLLLATAIAYQCARPVTLSRPPAVWGGATIRPSTLELRTGRAQRATRRSAPQTAKRPMALPTMTSIT